MMKKRLLITGSSGKIGRALSAGLSDTFDIVPFDLPEYDATNYHQLLEKLEGCYAVIHLAFDYKSENSRTGRKGNIENLLMGQTTLAAAAKANVKKCIMASSVNVSRPTGYNNWSYRTTKVALEREAEEYAERFPENDYISIRFGRVTPDNLPPALPLRDDQTWISNQDASNLLRTILTADSNNGKHIVIYGISNRPNPPYDTINPWGWKANDIFGTR